MKKVLLSLTFDEALALVSLAHLGLWVVRDEPADAITQSVSILKPRMMELINLTEKLDLIIWAKETDDAKPGGGAA